MSRILFALTVIIIFFVFGASSQNSYVLTQNETVKFRVVKRMSEEDQEEYQPIFSFFQPGGKKQKILFY